MAAEIPQARHGIIRPPGCFNEAAANGRGNRVIEKHGRKLSEASMRPRRMAAEIQRVADIQKLVSVLQ